MKFEAKKSAIDEEFSGKITQGKFNSTVIIKKT